MNFLFPYMARWKAVNWTRYHHIFTRLAESGHTIHIIQPPPSNLLETNFQEIEVDLPENLHLRDVEINTTFWNFNFPLNKLVKKGYFSIASIRNVREIIRKYDIDVLFLYNIPQYPLLRINSCIKVFDFADDYIAMLDQELGKSSNPLLLKIGQSILNKMVEKSDLTFAVSQVLAEKIGGKIYVIPNGVDLDQFKIGSGSKIRERYKRPIIGFIGSFEYFIDFDIILGAAQKLPHLTFLLVGNGRDFERVKKRIENSGLSNVVLIGGVTHSEIMRHIDAMDICLNIFKKIPISHSACPIKLFEYLAMKKPVISTRLDEVKRMFGNNLFYADSVNELVQSIDIILKNRDALMKNISKCYKLIKENYKWNNIVEDILEKINEIN